MLISQSLWVNSIIGLGALVLLVVSADVAVKKLISLAAYFKLSTTFMGMTVVSLATSIPEITAHLTASFGILRGTLDYRISSAIVLGANIGSDVIQQTLILGLVVLIAGGLYFRRYFLWKSMVPMIGTTLMCIVLGWDRVYSRIDGLILFGMFIAYTYYLYIDERKYYEHKPLAPAEDDNAEIHIPESRRQALQDAVISLVALMLTVASATVTLEITELIVHQTGIGGSLIGVVTLGVAAALPEFVTAISGIGNEESGISLGTLIGSNITNPLVAIGGGALLSTYWVPGPLVWWDLPWETVTGALLWVIAWFSKGRLNKVSAFYLIALYFCYLILRTAFFAVD